MIKVFVATGVMQAKNTFELMTGIYSCGEPSQAIEAHIKWMAECKPGWMLHETPSTFQVPNEFILEAADNIRKGMN